MFLTIAGVTMRIDPSQASQSEGTLIGAETRAFAGALRSQVRGRKRQWRFTTSLMTAAEVATFRALVDAGQFVTCSGDALGGSVTCSVKVGDAPYIRDRSLAVEHRRRLTLVLDEV